MFTVCVKYAYDFTDPHMKKFTRGVRLGFAQTALATALAQFALATALARPHPACDFFMWGFVKL